MSTVLIWFMIWQEKQVIQAQRAGEKGFEELAKCEDAGGSHGRARWQAETALDGSCTVPTLAGRAHGDVESSQPIFYKV